MKTKIYHFKLRSIAKAKKKAAKEASSIFHHIMKASVKDNPKPKPDAKKQVKRSEKMAPLYSYDFNRWILCFHPSQGLIKKARKPKGNEWEYNSPFTR